MAALHVHLLGGIRVEADGVAVEVSPPRALSVFVYLALHRDRPPSRAHLAYLLWPDSGEGQARTNLRQTLHLLRRALPASDRFLDVDGSRLRWRTGAQVVTDVERFEAALAEANAARLEADDAREQAQLLRATEAYLGPLAAELYEDWIEAPRARLHVAQARTLERLADLHDRRGDTRAAQRWLERLVQHEPLDEVAYRRLMALHTRNGERGRALQVYHRCASTLQREVGAEPSPETLALLDARAAEAPPTLTTHATGARHAHGLPQAPLIGRRHDLDRLGAAWRETCAGRSHLLLVTGDAGVGKTRLVETFMRRIERPGVRVLTTRCHAAEGTLPYGPLVSLLQREPLRGTLPRLGHAHRRELRRLLHDLDDASTEPPAPVTEPWQRVRLFDALARTVRSEHGPTLLAVDDLPWSDRDSVEWLHYLLRDEQRHPLLIVATARSFELVAHTFLEPWCTLVRGEGLLVDLVLAPLDAADTGVLVETLTSRPLTATERGRWFDETEGNPLFVVELVRAALAQGVAPSAGLHRRTPLPPRLRAVIESRLGRLTPAASELVALAATIGRGFDLALLREASGVTEAILIDALDEAWRLQVVRDTAAGPYEFSHDRLREVAYERVGALRRRRLHRAVALALAARADEADVDVSSRVAYHFDRAGECHDAIRWHLRAADVAHRLYANSDALAAFDRVLELAQGLPRDSGVGSVREARARAAEGAGDVHARAGNHERAIAAFRRALRYRARSQRFDRARLWQKLARRHMFRYDYAATRAAIDAAVAALGPEASDDDHAWWQVWIEVQLSRVWGLYWQQAWAEVGPATPRLGTVVARHGTPLQRVKVAEAQAMTQLGASRYAVSDASVMHAAAAHSAAHAFDDTRVQANATFLYGFVLCLGGDTRGARRRLQEALAGAERTGETMLRARVLAYQCFNERRAGDTAAVQDLLPASLAAATKLRMPEYVGAVHGHRAWLAWREGDVARCEREAAAALSVWREGQPYFLHWCARLPRLAAALARDDVSTALEHAEALLDTRQQQLPAALSEALAAALDAGGHDVPDAARVHLERAIQAAVRSGHL